MRRITFLISFLFIAAISFSQTAMDALRFSTIQGGGTARTMGVGGALGALGADYSVLSINPAGLARFRGSEFVISPSLYIGNAKSQLKGATTSYKETKANFNLNNLGLIIHNKPRGIKWKTSNFGIGFNRISNFTQETYFKGKTKGSYTDRLIELADGLFPSELDNFEAGLGFDVGAIYNDPNDETFYSSDFDVNQEVLKEERLITSGSINELVFSLGANYNEKLMIGGTVGIPFFSYTSNKTYSEFDENEEIDFFNSLKFNEDLTTSGVGVNIKLGLIYHITKMIRIGAAVHSPTFISLTDNWSTKLEYDYTDDMNDGPINGESEPGAFDYKLRTPLRAIASVGFLFKKNGFLSADIEWVDYSAASFNLTANSASSEDATYEKEVNDDIAKQFTSAINLRIGGEYALKNFRLRAGFGLNGTAYAVKDITNTNYSLGIGYRLRKFYIDLAYRKSITEEERIPYNTLVAQKQLSINDFRNDQILLTLGFKF